MILFCDSSALVKLYLQEEHSDAIGAQAAVCEGIAVCRIAWVEVMSAMARRSRERAQDATPISVARMRFESDWSHYLCLEVTQELVALAGDYADTFALRAYDSVQLAAAEIARRDLPGEVQFVCFDARLAKAARVLGIGAA